MAGNQILAINGGSSSIKFAVFDLENPGRKQSGGHLERVGDAKSAAKSVAGDLARKIGAGAVAAIGHRIVHGGLKRMDHQLITPEVLTDLRTAQAIDLAHLPGEIALIEACAEVFGNLPQIACFDTAFYRDMPSEARLLPIPRELSDAGIRRFGFHGLSYSYLMDRLRDLGAAGGRIVLAHLGSGASMTAVANGRVRDTTMSFTPLAGLVMGTRSGDLDPGLIVHLMREKKMSPDEMEEFLTQRCGMLGISQTSADMRDLIAAGKTDGRANDAVVQFCYQVRKHLGALATVIHGLDTIVFTGGIGEHSPPVRAAICDVDFLGVTIDPAANGADRPVISSPASRVTVRVIATDEESVIARETARIYGSTRRR